MDPSHEPLKILLVDDHTVVRKGLAQLVREDYPDALILEVASEAEAIRQYRQQAFTLVITDISLGDSSGIDLIKKILAVRETRILVLSMHPEEQYALRALKAGAFGYLTKDTAPELMSQAVRNVLNGKKYVSPVLAELLASHIIQDNSNELHDTLSDREFEVFKLIAKGVSLTEIGNSLSLSVNTVSTYRSRILQKMNMRTNSDLIKYALEKGII